MSSSTIFIKKPINYRQSFVQLKEKYKDLSPFLSFLLWTFSGFYAASKTGFNSNITGLTLSFAIYDLVVMSLTSVLLYRGLESRSILLLLPWIAMTGYTLYFNHYLGIVTTISMLKKVKKVSWIPWANLAFNVVLLIIRLTLAIRVLQLCVNLWFKKKLEEMKKKFI